MKLKPQKGFWNMITSHENRPRIPFESEQIQKFQITISPPVLHAKRKYSLTLDNFSLSS